MTTQRTDRRFGRRIKSVLLGFVLFEILKAVVVVSIGFFQWWWILPPYAALGAAMWASYRMWAYRCSRCGRRIGTVTLEGMMDRKSRSFPQRKTIVFYCDACDIVWDSTILRPSGDFG